MGLLSPQDVSYLKDLFGKELRDDVRILLFKSDDKSRCEYCDIAENILEEVAELDDRIKVEVYDIDSNGELAQKYNLDGKVPAMVFLTKDGEDKGVRYYGLPSGHEFATVIQNIVSFSNGAIPQLSQNSINKLSNITSPVEILVFVTPTCPHCPRAVMMAHEIAKANENITAAMVEANEFPELSMRYSVSAVPHIVVNGRTAFVGAYPEDMFVEQVLEFVER